MDNANARTVLVAQEEDVTHISIRFISGSKISGGTQEAPVNGVPLFSVYKLASPARLVVEFSSLAYWDYERSLETDDPLILGWFPHKILGSDMYAIYFQLNSDVAFKVEESKDTLNISLVKVKDTEPTPEDDVTDLVDPGARFHVTANAYLDYCDGLLSREIELWPTLGDDLSTILLISRGFTTQNEADALRELTISLNEHAVPGEWSTVQLKHNELPHYDESAEYAAAYTVKNARIKDVELTLPVVIPNGHYLAVTPEGEYLFSRRIRTGGLGENAYIYEQVCVLGANGEAKPLLRFEFETVESVTYSPDGRRMAVLERAAENTHLYIFDLDTKEILTDLTQVGFGEMISAYVWDSMGSKLFAVSGTNTMTVNQYDFNIPTEGKRHSVVDKNGADEGSIAYANGEVYFAQTDMASGPVVYKIKPDGGVRKRVFEGSRFRLSPDSTHMAVSLSPEYTQANAGEAGFWIYDMQTGEFTLVNDAFVVYDFIWSLNGRRLFYFENRMTDPGGDGGDDESGNEADPYPYTLWVYDLDTGESREIADLPYTSIAVPQDPDIVLFRYYDSETMGGAVRATYSIKIN